MSHYENFHRYLLMILGLTLFSAIMQLGLVAFVWRDVQSVKAWRVGVDARLSALGQPSFQNGNTQTR